MVRSRFRLVVSAVGALGGLLLVVAEFLDLYVVRSRGATVAAGGAGAHHGYALLVLGLAVLVLVALLWRAAAPRMLGLALLVVGLVAVFVIVAIDLPDLGAEGSFGTIADPAVTRTAAGFYVETAGAVLVLLAGGLTMAGPRGS